MSHTVIEALIEMAPQAIAIAIYLLVAILGWFLGAFVALLCQGWKIDLRPNDSAQRRATASTAPLLRVRCSRKLAVAAHWAPPAGARPITQLGLAATVLQLHQDDLGGAGTLVLRAMCLRFRYYDLPEVKPGWPC